MKSALDHSLGFQGNSELTNDPSRVLVSDKVHTCVHFSLWKFVFILNLFVRIFHNMIFKNYLEMSQQMYCSALVMCMMQCGPLL